MSKLVFNPATGDLDVVLDKATEIQFDNVPTTLTSENVQDAIAELDGKVESIPDPITYKGIWDASTNTPTLSNSDVGVTGYLYQVMVAGSVNFGAGLISFEVGDKVVNNGSIWEKWDMTDAVNSVNGQTGFVNLTTFDIPESLNLYFTDTRARTAAVVDSMSGGEIDRAPSVNSVKSYIDSADGAFVRTDGTSAMTGDLNLNTHNIINVDSINSTLSTNLDILAGDQLTLNSPSINLFANDGQIAMSPFSIILQTNAGSALTLDNSSSAATLDSSSSRLQSGTNYVQTDNSFGILAQSNANVYINGQTGVNIVSPNTVIVNSPTGRLELDNSSAKLINTDVGTQLSLDSFSTLLNSNVPVYIMSPNGQMSMTPLSVNLLSNSGASITLDNSISNAIIDSGNSQLRSGSNVYLQAMPAGIYGSSDSDVNIHADNLMSMNANLYAQISSSDASLNLSNSVTLQHNSGSHLIIDAISTKLESVNDLFIASTNLLNIQNPKVYWGSSGPATAPIINNYVKTLILASSTTTAFEYPVSESSSSIIKYNVRENTTGESRVGELKVAYNPVTNAVSVTESSTETASVDLTFSVAYNGGTSSIVVSAINGSTNDIYVFLETTLFSSYS